MQEVELSNAEKAQKVATKILNAVAKKFPKYNSYVRRYETGDSGFVELALCPPGAGRAQEITTAYSDEYFLAATAENINDKARRILNDFRILMGAKGVS